MSIHQPTLPGGRSWRVSKVALVIPILNEESALPRLIRALDVLDPAPAEIIAVDGGSADASIQLVRGAGLHLLETECGRAVQINAGVAAASAPIVCVLHADTIPPDDAIAVIERVMADPGVALAGFSPLICGPEKIRALAFTTGSKPGTARS